MVFSDFTDTYIRKEMGVGSMPTEQSAKATAIVDMYSSFLLAKEWVYRGAECCKACFFGGIISRAQNLLQKPEKETFRFLADLAEKGILVEEAMKCLGIDYDPGCCDTCTIDEEMCNTHTCPKVAPFNKVVLIPENATPNVLLNALHAKLSEDEMQYVFKRIYCISFELGVQVFEKFLASGEIPATAALDEIITDDEIDVENLSKFTVTIEQLIGRNYYHYTDYKIDTEQPVAFDFSELNLDESNDEEDEDEVEVVEEAIDEDELSVYLPDNCWVKRFVDDDDPNTFYLMYIVLDEAGAIDESGCIEETSHQMGGGGFFFMIPGMEIPSVKTYVLNSCPPDKVIDDLRLLFSGRTIPLDFAFEGKRLPQKMIYDGGNGGSNTEYTFAVQSAYRLAYTHMSVDTDEDGVVEGFSYSTYQSSGSAYGDMFSRPVNYSGRRDEAMDMLLHIYDMYTDEELRTFD